MFRKIPILIAFIGTCLMIPPAFALAEAPEGYPVVESESISLLQLEYGQDNQVPGFESVHHSVRSSVAYSNDHQLILHAWLAEFNKTTAQDNADDQAIFVQMFDARTGDPVADPEMIFKASIRGYDADSDRLDPLPGNDELFLYKPDVNSLDAVYEPDSGHFLVMWSSYLMNSDSPAYPPSELDDKEGAALLGVAVTPSETGDWSAQGLQTIDIALSIANFNKSFTRPGLGGIHRFGKRNNGNLGGLYISYSEDSGFSLENAYPININDEIAMFDDGDIDPEPWKTADYDVAYDPVHDRYTVTALLIERYVSAAFGDPGNPTTSEYRFYSGIVYKTLDASLLTSADGPGSESLRSIIARTENTQFIQMTHTEGEPIPYPPRLHFEQVGVARQAATSDAVAKMNFYWSGREMTPASSGMGVDLGEQQFMSARRYEIRGGGTLGVLEGVPNVLPGSTTQSRMMFNPSAYWNGNDGVSTLVWGDIDQVHAQAISPTNSVPLPLPTTFAVNTGITPRRDNSFMEISPQFVEIDSITYAYFSNVNGAALQKLDWQWVDLAASSDLVGGGEDSPIGLNEAFALEVIVSNLDIGELPTDHDSGAFTLVFENTEGMELVSHDDALSGNMADGFTFNAQAGGIAAGGSRAFEFVLRNVNDSGADQAVELSVSLTAGEHFDFNANNNASGTSLTLSASADDSSDGDDAGNDTGDGTHDDTNDDDTGNGPGGNGGDGAGSGAGNSSGNDGGGGGGGAIFWLLGIPAILRFRR